MTSEEFNTFLRRLAGDLTRGAVACEHVWKVGSKVSAIGGWEETDGVPAFSFKVSDRLLGVVGAAELASIALYGEPGHEVGAAARGAGVRR